MKKYELTDETMLNEKEIAGGQRRTTHASLFSGI